MAEIVERGQGRFDRALVKRIERLVLLAEYKRRQAAPGVKLTKKAFGIGRKYPITNGYRDESDVVVPRAASRQGRASSDASSATRRRRPGGCISAMPARRCSTGCSRCSTGGSYVLRLDDTDRERSTEEFAQRHRRGSRLARHHAGADGPAVR